MLGRELVTGPPWGLAGRAAAPGDGRTGAPGCAGDDGAGTWRRVMAPDPVMAPDWIIALDYIAGVGSIT